MIYRWRVLYGREHQKKKMIVWQKNYSKGGIQTKTLRDSLSFLFNGLLTKAIFVEEQ